jgi:hypothetical protein
MDNIFKTMQKEKTIQFWNDFYQTEEELKGTESKRQEEEQTLSKEWILQPTTKLLHTIQNQCNTILKKQQPLHNSGTTTNNSSGSSISSDPTMIQQSLVFSMLEIGCGTSMFGLTLWEYLLSNPSTSSSTALSSSILQYHATDVSQVCIQQNRLRDEARILYTLQKVQSNIATSSFSSSKDSKNHPQHSFQYKHLDILYPDNHHDEQQYHLILDKGCLDTFLFRTKSKATSCTKDVNQDQTLMTCFFHNIHSLLMDNDDNDDHHHTHGGKYILFSPRSKIKQVRDFNGFSSVQKIKLDASSSGVAFGDLDGTRKDTNSSKHAVYMYVCTKNSHYVVGKSNVFSSVTSGDGCHYNEDDTCTKCHLSFHNFRNGENMVYKGKKYWYRRWKGHLMHCKA